MTDKCFECGGDCCKSAAIPIDTPEDLGDYQDLKWYLFHKGFMVYIDEDGDWHVDIDIPCMNLGKDGKCKIYDERPPICRDYDLKDCDCEEDTSKIVEFHTPKDVDKYIAKLKKEGKL